MQTPKAVVIWRRVEPGHYVGNGESLGRYEIVRVPTTFGIRRASNDLWEVRVNGVRCGPRRKYLARAKQDAEALLPDNERNQP